MSITYAIHDVSVEHARDGEEGTVPGGWSGLDPAIRAAIKMQGVGEIGAVLMLPCAGAPLLVTTGYGQSRPDLAYPLYWIKRSLYVPRAGGEAGVVRMEWEPVVGVALAGTLPSGFDADSRDNTLHCLDVELCQILMMLTIACGRRRLNRALPDEAVAWYRAARQRPAPELSGVVFDTRRRPCTNLWTRRASGAVQPAAARRRA